MLEELSIVRLASAMARHAGARHRVVAENVANADTPGYGAHMVGFRGPAHPQVIEDPTALTSPNGNSVNLEGEMVKAVQAQGQHAMALTIYRKVHDLMRIGLGRPR